MRPQDLNYQHLRYFHAVAHEGSVLAASRRLHLAPSTVSGQIKSLERALGHDLLERSGRGVALTPFGETVLEIADAIFDLGANLVHHASSDAHRDLVRVGVSFTIPKLLTRELLARDSDQVLLRIEHGHLEDLLGRLGARRLDVVLADAPVPPWLNLQATSHLVVTSGIGLFGSPALHQQVQDDPATGLQDVPWLVPPMGTPLRTGIQSWWEQLDIQPEIAAVIDDSALLKALGDAGVGVFVAPERMLDAVLEGYNVRCIGTTQAVQERVYAISREPEPRQPYVRALCQIGEAIQN